MVTAVVLAAGTSSRMGRHKLVLPLGGEPIVRRTVRQVLNAGFDQVLVVVGSHHEQTVAALDGLAIMPVLNPDFATGMGSSFRSAVAHLGDSRAALFALADQVMVPSAEYRRMRDTYLDRGFGIVCARYGNVTAPPHVFDREFFPELSALEHGARSVLERHRDQTHVLQLDPALLLDIDTPEDYERACAKFDPEAQSP
jgi:molybdenum cofactor cytidylyltransferase